LKYFAPTPEGFLGENFSKGHVTTSTVRLCLGLLHELMQFRTCAVFKQPEIWEIIIDFLFRFRNCPIVIPDLKFLLRFGEFHFQRLYPLCHAPNGLGNPAQAVVHGGTGAVIGVSRSNRLNTRFDQNDNTSFVFVNKT
jgi:hypothetical protein